MSVIAFTSHAALDGSVGAVIHTFGKLFSRFHWTSLLSAALICLVVWAWRARREPEARQGFLSFLFPREVWLHRSALLDYRFVLFDKVVLALLIGIAAMFVSPHAVDSAVKGGQWAVRNAAQASLGIVIAYTVALLVTEDFFRYWAHRLMHTSPFLWHFHKVHHSSETLVPFSELRTHPVNGLVNLIRGVIAVPLVTVIFLLVFPGKLTAMSILGVNAGRFVFNIAGAQLRHSHVWLSFGPVLSRLVISPAMHQIHHSRAPEHRNLNYGSQFAIWDWLFGTLYVPQRRERLEFGIDREDTERMRTVAALYLVPFKDAWALARTSYAERQARRAAAAYARLGVKSG